jgi:glucose/arabinose dehydrogenase
LRNPYGVAFDNKSGKLIVSMNGADERGNRTIANDMDKVYTIDVSKPVNSGKWYG